MLFKCKMCGGELEILEGSNVCECMHCGTRQTLPKISDEKRCTLYDRANHFRRNGDYDKAKEIYERILEEDKTDAEAYWSLILCKYGVEYVEDTSRKKRVPTCNRTQFGSIFADEDYRAAMEHAVGAQKKIFEEEAKAIDEIQRGILSIVQNEEPFDVFISYKETDNAGKRTLDSVLAQELYYELAEAGFRVFLARITLEDKPGTAYEPYIFAALNSAKVMVVIGTKVEYINSVWVKNEWSRYLALIKQGEKKTLIPAYRDLDPYELPEELGYFQAQNMDKLGFMQDLIHGIKKIVEKPVSHEGLNKNSPVNRSVDIGNSPNMNGLLKRAFICLEYREWQEAGIFFEQVLNQDPTNAEAYIGKLMIDFKIEKRESLQDAADVLASSLNYAKACRFADDETRKQLEQYNDIIIKRKKDEERERTYQSACKKMERTAISALESAIKQFEEMKGYKDSADKIVLCQEKIVQLQEEKRIQKEKEEKQRQEQRQIQIKEEEEIRKSMWRSAVVFVILSVLAGGLIYAFAL